ncbi:MAG: hypothetical protein HY902_14895, partial [Deltaproteobacteria bacterium]|nr:hypothetical protein [Deltaproteobacteria bacterium]
MTAARWCALALAALLGGCAAPQQTDGGADAETLGNRSALDASADSAAVADSGKDTVPDSAAPVEVADAAAVDPADGAVPETAPADTGADGAQPGDTATEPPPALAPCRGELSATSGWTGQVAYEIFVRSFADSNGDGIGDLKGIVNKFDYLNDGKPGGDDLGVTLLWLMPVMPSPSYHGYDGTDYMNVNPAYGTLADLDALVALAHSRGVKIVLDFVANHTSPQHPWFVDSAAATGHKDWYVWRDTTPETTWKQPWSGGGKVWHTKGKRWYYGVFSGNMPDLNVQVPAVTAALQQAAGFWLDRGIDGFRLDAVRYLIETGPGKGQQDTQATLDWWGSFAKYSHTKQPGSLLVGEAWASNTIAAKYQQAGLDMTFDFDLQTSLLNAVAGGLGDGVEIVTCQQEGQFPAGAPRGVFLSNHDQLRWASQISDPDAQKLAETLLFFVPGTPFLYYGEEIGAPNGAGTDDKQKRLPMRWNASPNGGFTTGTPWQPLADGPDVASQLQDPQSLLRHVQKLVAAWRQTPALQRGAWTVLDAPDGWLLAVRTLGSVRVLGVFKLD